MSHRTVVFALLGLALAQSARTEPLATEASTAVVIVDTLAAHATDVWPFRLNGLMHARITLQIENPLRVQCRLLDPDGAPVRIKQVVSDRCRFAWTPARTGAYRLEIRNLVGAALPYVVRARQMGGDR